MISNSRSSLGALYHRDGRPVDMTFEAEQLNGLITYLRQVHEDVPSRLMEPSIKSLLDTLPFFGSLTAKARFPKILRLSNSRGRLQNKRIIQMADLGAPPRKEVTWYNRCYMPGESMFYGAFDPITLIEETHPEVGDRISISTWEQRDSHIVSYCPIFLNQPTSSWNPRTWRFYELYQKKLNELLGEIRPMVEALNLFVADTFTRPCSNPANDMEYLFCGYFASRLLHQMDADNVDAIWYPSVKAGLTRENIAVKPEVLRDHYKLTKVQEHIVGETLRYSEEAVAMVGGQTCDRFNYETGTILWE